MVYDPTANGGERVETIGDIVPGGKVQVVEQFTQLLRETRLRAVPIARLAMESRSADLDEAKLER